ncbi:tRNA adenosine(34) deaminase TadA [Myxococcota bacterium]|nr:tRNA adenosine(34) deaminase TadA [Myxococcota bacterium]MBU1534483.1 tRNA adenosine(34) deaminase TadA [Myxococcota bacterium]
MKEALSEALLAREKGEVPVGAVVVKDNHIIARGHNLRETLQDPSAHAEIIALREAGRVLGSWNLQGLDLYVTLEPCPMCAGAIVNSRISTVVFGARDPKAGAVRTLFALCEDPRLNHRVTVVEGISRDESARLLSDFFASLRGADTP